MGAVPCEPSVLVAAIPFYGFRSCFHGSERISLARAHDSIRGDGQQASRSSTPPSRRRAIHEAVAAWRAPTSWWSRRA
jgi:hypothetical protein